MIITYFSQVHFTFVFWSSRSQSKMITLHISKFLNFRFTSKKMENIRSFSRCARYFFAIFSFFFFTNDFASLEIRRIERERDSFNRRWTTRKRYAVPNRTRHFAPRN